MCRHLAYLGPPMPLASLVFDAQHSLRDQARAPRHQPPGQVNPDGWGVAWWEARGGEAARYRTTTAIWDDDGFDARPWARAAIAAARRASPGTSRREANNAPFLSERWAFSLNGFGFGNGRRDRLLAGVSPARRRGIAGDTDSEVLFALALDRLDAGASPSAALAAVVEHVAPDDETFLNLLLTDGSRLAATRHRNSLFVRRDKGVCVASEPLDDDPSWREVPDGSIVTGGPE